MSRITCVVPIVSADRDGNPGPVSALEARGDASRELEKSLKTAGLRVTPARVAALDLIEAAVQPLSHAEAVSLLANVVKDSVTVFRALNDLARVGLLRRIDLGDRVWRFESNREDVPAHPHFICAVCGAISCLLDLELHVPLSSRVPRALRRGEVHVHLRGRCDACRPQA